MGFTCEQPKRQPQPDFFLKNWAIRVTLCVKGAYLSQLSFPQIVISFSTWQAEQKKLGKEDGVHLLYSIPDIWEEEGNCCVCLSRCACMLHSDISGDVDTSANVTLLHCCIFCLELAFYSAMQGMCSCFLCAGRIWLETQKEKRQRDLASVTPDQASSSGR